MKTLPALALMFLFLAAPTADAASDADVRIIKAQTVLIEEVKKPRLLRPHDLGGIHSPRKYWPESQRPNRVKLTEGIKRTRSFLMKATQETTAGAPGGGQFTPWKRTVVLLKEFLKKKGKATVKEILAEIDHHYRSGSSARDGITRIMGTFEKQHFKMTRDGKEIYWELTDPESVTDKSSSRDPRTYVYSEDD